MPLPSAPGEATLVGAVLSRRYELTREIGRGGMGAVYAARPLAGGAEVAIKILHPYFVCDELVMTRFMDEGRTCMRLAHPNILRVHDCLAAEDGSPYLVMDLLEGVPLSAYTRDGGRVALGRAIPILQGMLAGLEAAHAAGVVHRDLKPGNVFLAREGAGSVFGVKLLDFGIAKVMDAAGGMGTKTSTGALLGTPAYMSPEQVKNAKDVDGRSDLWSVGVMFYEMLSGRVAFPAPTEYARLAAVISARPAPIESIDADLLGVSPFLARALEKDRDRRFQTAREMAEALGALAVEAPVSAAKSTPLAGARHLAGLAKEESPTHVSRRPLDDEAAWSLATDQTSPPSAALAPRPAPAAAQADDVLVAQMFVNANSSTLASPRRSAAPTVTPAPTPSHTPPPVVVVPDAELEAARERLTVPPAVRRDAARHGVAAPLVAALVVIALAAGFVLGLLYAGRH